MTYDLDALRAAVEKTRRGPLLLGGNPHQDKADVIEYSQSLDRVRQSLLIAARSGLLDDAALGMAVLGVVEAQKLVDATYDASCEDDEADIPFLAACEARDEAVAKLKAAVGHRLAADIAARALIAMQEVR